jgi:hypothetical protein
MAEFKKKLFLTVWPGPVQNIRHLTAGHDNRVMNNLAQCAAA